MNDLEKGWVAGIIDGEGTILITRENKKNYHHSYYGLQVCVTSVDIRIVNKLKNICGGHIIFIRRKTKERYIPYYRWYIHRKPALKLLQELRDLIVSKEKEVGLAIKFQLKKKIGAPKGSWGRPKFKAKEQEYFENCHEKMKAIRRNKRVKHLKMCEKRLAQGVL